MSEASSFAIATDIRPVLSGFSKADQLQSLQSALQSGTLEDALNRLLENTYVRDILRLPTTSVSVQIPPPISGLMLKRPSNIQVKNFSGRGVQPLSIEANSLDFDTEAGLFGEVGVKNQTQNPQNVVLGLRSPLGSSVSYRFNDLPPGWTVYFFIQRPWQLGPTKRLITSVGTSL